MKISTIQKWLSRRKGDDFELKDSLKSVSQGYRYPRQLTNSLRHALGFSLALSEALLPLNMSWAMPACPSPPTHPQRQGPIQPTSIHVSLSCAILCTCRFTINIELKPSSLHSTDVCSSTPARKHHKTSHFEQFIVALIRAIACLVGLWLKLTIVLSMQYQFVRYMNLDRFQVLHITLHQQGGKKTGKRIPSIIQIKELSFENEVCNCHK